MPVPLDELKDLFTGVPDESGGWATSPCHSVMLALEICRRVDPGSIVSLRTVVFDTSEPDLLDEDALKALDLGFQRWRQTRHQQGARGL